jgi:hypothetical protein
LTGIRLNRGESDAWGQGRRPGRGKSIRRFGRFLDDSFGRFSADLEAFASFFLELATRRYFWEIAAIYPGRLCGRRSDLKMERTSLANGQNRLAGDHLNSARG